MERYRTSYWPGTILLVLSFAIALFTYKDYGIAWDEKIQKRIGEVSYDYIVHGDQTLKKFEDRNYGVGYELVLTAIERQCHITDTRALYHMRHLVSHTLFLFSIFCGYVLILRLFKKQWLAGLGFILLAFHPRIYAHSFFNTKDLPFLSIVLISLLVSHIAFERNKRGWYILLGLCIGYATCIRLLGILPAFLLCLFFISDLFYAVRNKEKIAPVMVNFISFLISYVAAVYIPWPYLWSAPLHNFISIFKSVSHFPWNGSILFNGQLLNAQSLPWTFLPGWFVVTTPVVWLLAGIAGIMLVVISFIRKPGAHIKNTPDRNYILYLLCVLLPVISVIALHSVVYDDWRHVFFVYPPFVILALYAINKIPPGKIKQAVIALCFVQLIGVGYFMVRNHPFHQVYFNELVSRKSEYLRNNFEMDYWGAAYKQGYEYIIAHDSSTIIKVWESAVPAKNNRMILPEAARNRIQLVNAVDSADYFITNFRGHTSDFDYPNAVYEIKVLNSTIMRVYKLR